MGGGGDWVEATMRAVRAARVVLVIIGRDWLETSSGWTRVAGRADFVHEEIAAALDAGRHVVPVLLDEARMPTAEELPTSIRQLSRLNAVHVRHETFGHDFQHLIQVCAQARPRRRLFG